jgi:GT2 family glycosyltransferase
MDLSVVVVTYRSRAHVLECLRSLSAGLSPPGGGAPAIAWECVVLDNDSGDGTAELVESQAPGVRVVRTGANLGYAKAVNRGIASTTGRAILVLNPDCIWRPGGIDALLGWLAGHPRCGIAVPRILNPDGSLEYSVRAYPTPAVLLFNRYSLLTRIWPGNPWTRRYLLTDWDHRTPRAVDWASGAAMLVRREAATAVGGMDEAFFMFNEDVDWCRRMNGAGWTVDYVPAAEVVHHIGASKGKGGVAKRVILERHRGMIHYYRKHHPVPQPFDALAALVVMARARLMLLLGGRD